MKKLFSLLVALMMMACCVGAVAEAVPAEEMEPATFGSENLTGVSLPYTVDLDISLNWDMLNLLLAMMAPDADQEVVGLVLSLVDNLGMKDVVTDAGEEVSFTLNDQPIITMGYSESEQEAVVVSDLFPNYALTMPLEEGIDRVDVDLEALMEALLPYIMEIGVKVNDYVVGVEEGEYTVEGHTFTSRTKVQMTDKEVDAMMGELLAKLQQDETVMALLSEQLGLPVDASDVPLFPEDVEDGEDAEEAIMTIYLYANDESTYMTMEIAQDDLIVYASLGNVGGQINLQLLAGMDIFLSQEDMRQAAMSGSADAVLLNLSIAQGETTDDVAIKMDAYMGMYMGMNMQSASQEDESTAVNMDFYFLFNHQPLLTISGVSTPGGELTMPVDVEGKTAVSMAEPTTDEEYMAYQMGVYGLAMDLSSYGLNNVLAKAATAMPEEVIALITYLNTPTETTESVVIDGVNE